MAPSLQAPPNCGRRLLPAVLDEVAAEDPQRIFVSVPQVANDLAEGFEDITYGRFAQAVNKCAWWLREHVGPPSDPKTIFYIGPLDVRYLIVIIAAAKAGHIAFFSSHRNSLEAHVSLLERSNSTFVLRPAHAPAILEQIMEARPMTEIAMPETDFFFADLESVEKLPFTLTWEEAHNKPFCILHTSGSTGIPKPVFVPYGSLASNDAHQLIPSLGGKPTLMNYLQDKRFFLALPVFHAACLTFVLAFNIFSGVTVVLPPPGPLTADVANDVFVHGRLDGALLAPSLIVDLYNNHTYRKNMVEKLSFLSYVGGSLPEAVGDALSTQVKLMSIMGTCETLLYPLEMNDDPADWEYVTISPFFGHQYQLDRDGLSELVLVRQPKYEQFQGAFYTFPDKTEYHFSDLFAQHPRKPESWVFRARTDDIIAFTTAEKLNPITMESVIVASPKIKSAVIGGHGQFQASVLIEPYAYPATPAEEQQFIQDIWPQISLANRDCPAHGRIMKGFAMLTKPDKPLPRAGKDTVQRHAVFKLYADEWKALYDSKRPHVEPQPAPAPAAPAASPTPASTVPSAAIDRAVEDALNRLLPGAVEKAVQGVLARLLTGLSGTAAPSTPVTPSTLPASPDLPAQEPPTLTNGTHKTNGIVNGTQAPDLKRLIHDRLAENLDMTKITDDADLFQFGLDSLQVVELINSLNTYLKEWRPSVAPVERKAVYANPTVNQIMALMA
ncbi:thioester reductase domain-containing protein [Penicillium hispanicum]|uniref:thioester reductase domain-containing protein n=1 Tax=Penicillium hispanicum TaxID=1080232 RepID=UPI00254023CB|nr:thioester reductase domain-containing protein [Penicillium hispanicum]KAJ5578055.1 thioester reductase domain-containing protein [Penicillium hispanicum]